METYSGFNYVYDDDDSDDDDDDDDSVDDDDDDDDDCDDDDVNTCFEWYEHNGDMRICFEGLDGLVTLLFYRNRHR